MDRSSRDGRHVLSELRKCMQTSLALTDEETAAIDRTTTPARLPRWTSLAHLELMLSLERTFGVTFDAEEIVDLASVDAIVRAVERKTSDR